MGPQTLSGRCYLPFPYSYYSHCLEQTQPRDCGGPGSEGDDQSPAPPAEGQPSVSSLIKLFQRLDN